MSRDAGPRHINIPKAKTDDTAQNSWCKPQWSVFHGVRQEDRNGWPSRRNMAEQGKNVRDIEDIEWSKRGGADGRLVGWAECFLPWYLCPEHPQGQCTDFYYRGSHHS